jgi:DNA-binding transcriptional MerR regulator
VGTYSIKELERLSGIKAHTIRIWEKRYSLIHPQRTSTNIRFYSDEDLKKIMNISALNNHGIRISKIADMSVDEINRQIFNITDAQPSASAYIEQLVLAMVDLEEEQFEKIVNALVKKFGFERAITEGIYPFLEKIGILWQTKNITPAQEHFISNLIRQKIIVAIDGLPMQTNSKKRAVIFLPEHEQHEIGLLFNYYLARYAGFKCYYLGQSVPHNDLIDIVQTYKPDILITSITIPMMRGTSAYLELLSRQFPKQQILVSGIQAADLPKKSLANIQNFSNILRFKELLSNY